MKKTLIASFVASLTQQPDSTATGVIQLFPAGEFRARDGRPAECAAWIMTREVAERLIAAADARDTPYVLDYEHQTLRAAKNGQPAPAAAFFKKLEWREGEGLFAVDVEWTVAAAAMVEAKEYRFISPVFSYDKTGQVLELLNAALTNTPALDGMDDVLLAAASLMTTHLTTEGNTEMDEEFLNELLSNLRWMLNLPTASTPEEVQAELEKIIALLSKGEGTAAASVSLLDVLNERDQTIQTIADLTAKLDTPDPAKWVSVDVMHAAVQQAAEKASTTSQAALATQEAETLITAALDDGRLLPAQEEWAKSLAKTDPESLKTFIGKAPKIAALTTSQTLGQPPKGAPERKTVENDDDAIDPAICSLMGTDPEDVAKYLK
ncbi:MULTISPECIES: phage protease [Citrobacter]|uniref:phage protease n=1 Tax=Citrobacter TaxID=544 RepID=UPI0016814A60|nr:MULTISPECIES: phage protease [Citrobacter]MCK7561596.1 phage protease [Citrobacter koseri]MDM2952798.1 phage protease [Citrobacter sp. CK203]MDM3032019.1 phage protease [Citrobacter sp. CK186]BCL49810.1 peptidase [Citrobacter koseri]